jgi:hypothetical protein
MAVSAQRLTVDPGLRDGVNSLITIEAEELGNDSSGGDLDQNNVIKTDAIERI